MRIDVLSLFPDYFRGPFDESIIKRAREAGILDIRLTDIRSYTDDPHRRVDDRPYGGGPGMVMMPGPLVNAIRAVKSEKAKLIYLSPQGIPLNAAKCRELAQESHLIFICGHYEGIDERVYELERGEEISIGDYVLTNGCIAAIVCIDALSRFIPGVIGHEEAANQDSFENGLLDCPHYTKPRVFEELAVPEVLMDGHHKKIKEFKRAQAEKKTQRNRPDLYKVN